MERTPIFVKEGTTLYYPRTGYRWTEFVFANKVSHSVGMFLSPDDNIPVFRGYNCRRDFYKTVTNVLGMPPAVICRIFNGNMLDLWQVEPFHSNLGFCMKGLSPLNVHRIHAVLPLLQQAEAVGAMNITPFIHFFGVGPGKLREMFGRGLWKELSHNSFSRNKAFVERAKHISGGLLNAETNCCSSAVELIRSIRSAPTTFLRSPLISSRRLGEHSLFTFNLLAHDLGSYMAALKYLKANPSSIFMPRDTRNLLEQEGHPPLKSPSFKVWQDRHDKLVELRTRRKYSKDPVTPQRPTQVIDGFEFVHLVSAFSLQEEGTALHHCVGSYIGYVKTGNFLAFSVRKDGRRVGTLSYNKVDRTKNLLACRFWETHQFLGYCNSPIVDTDALNAWSKFTMEINK